MGFQQIAVHRRTKELWYVLRSIAHGVSFDNKSVCPEVNHDRIESSDLS